MGSRVSRTSSKVCPLRGLQNRGTLVPNVDLIKTRGLDLVLGLKEYKPTEKKSEYARYRVCGRVGTGGLNALQVSPRADSELQIDEMGISNLLRSPILL